MLSQEVKTCLCFGCALWLQDGSIESAELSWSLSWSDSLR